MDGIRRGYVNQPSGQGYGAYDPSMAGPNFNQYFAMIAEMIQGHKEQKATAEQEEYERGIEERKMKVTEGRLELESEKEPPEPDFMKRARALMTANPEMTFGEALNTTLKVQKEDRIPPVLPKAFEAKMTKDYEGADWRGRVEYTQFKDDYDEWQLRTRPAKPGAPKDITERERGRQIGLVKGLTSGVNKLKLGYQKATSKGPIGLLLGSEYSSEDAQGKMALLDKIGALASEMNNALIFEQRTLNSSEENVARMLNKIKDNFEGFWKEFSTLRNDPDLTGRSDEEILEALLRVF